MGFLLCRGVRWATLGHVQRGRFGACGTSKHTGAHVWSAGHVSGTLGAWLGCGARVVVAVMAVLPGGRAETVWVGSCGVVVSGGRPRRRCDGRDVLLTAPSMARGSVAGLVWNVWCAWGAWGACQVLSYGVGGGVSSVAWVQFVVMQQGRQGLLSSSGQSFIRCSVFGGQQPPQCSSKFGSQRLPQCSFRSAASNCLNVLPVRQPAAASVFFRWALVGLSLRALSRRLSFLFSFLFFDLGLPVTYTRFKSVVVARWGSTKGTR